MTQKNRINTVKITSVAVATIVLIGSLSLTTAVFADPQPKPTINFGITPNPVVAGDQVTMSGNVTLNGVGLEAGKLQLQQGFNEDNTAASSCQANHFTTIVDDIAHLGGDYSYNGFDTSGKAGQTLVFQMNIAPAGPNTGFSANQSVCIPLEINDVECEGDLQIAATQSKSDPDHNSFAYTINVKACKNIENLKIQGGSNGWSTSSINPPDNPNVGSVEVKPQPKKNTVYIWSIPNLNKDQEGTLTVDLNGYVSCGKTVNLNGGWSVSYNIQGSPTKLKSEYTNPLTFTNQCPF